MKFEVLTSILIFGIIASIIWTNSNNTNTYAQLQKQALPTAQPTPTPKLHAVKIISPTKGQQVPPGKDLTISGTSITNATSNCQVSVIVNHVKPYQPSTATGPGGGKDFSKWNFILTSNYTTIKPGPENRITAKYSCPNNPSLTSFSSLNVTGITASTSVNQSKAAGNVTTLPSNPASIGNTPTTTGTGNATH